MTGGDHWQLLFEKVGAALASPPAANGAARPRRITLKAEPRPGRTAALVITEHGGGVDEVLLNSTVCKELAGILTAASR
jgi:hypothetical protein